MNEDLHDLAAALHSRMLDGDLNEEERRWLAGHRAQCAACAASFAGIERLAAALGGLERYQPRAGFADRVLGEVRPAPVPVWARWRISTVWGRVAAFAMLATGGLAFLTAPAVLGLVVEELGGWTALFRAPGLLADALVGLLRQLDPLRALIEVGSVLGRALLAAAASPQVLLALSGSALVSAGAFLELSHILAASQRRRSSHA